jgi:formate C-acetyltransferase
MYEWKPMTDRVTKMRERYRTTVPWLSVDRFKIVTDFYQENPQLHGVLLRAENFKNLCEKIQIGIHEDELIVGGQSKNYKGTELYPESSIEWLLDDVASGAIENRLADPYHITDKDAELLLERGPWWVKRCLNAQVEAIIPEGWREMFPDRCKNWANDPNGHAITGHKTLVQMGFKGKRDDAYRRMKQLEEEGIPDKNAEKYYFYRAVVTCMEGAMTLTHRYAALAAELAEKEVNSVRAKELKAIAENIESIAEEPPTTFFGVLQLVYLYQNMVCLDDHFAGLSFGRLDQLFYPFYKKDKDEGRITEDEAQELIDVFTLKAGEMNKVRHHKLSEAVPGYGAGQPVTIGGVDTKTGEDATNDITYMFVEAMARLKLHDPSLNLRINKNTPDKLWEMAIEGTRINGGVPVFENDEVIIPSFMDGVRNFTIEDARDYALVGCIEPGGNGNDWPCPGSVPCGIGNMIVMVNCLINGIFDGHDPGLAAPGEDPLGPVVGPHTGWLKDMKSMDEVLDAVVAQMDFWEKWRVASTNVYEYLAAEMMPTPVTSAFIEGCMDSGKDVLAGGAKYNSYGIIGLGFGSLVDALSVLDWLLFTEKKCTAEELADALLKNWEGYEDLHALIINEAPHYGNDDPLADKYAEWVANTYAARTKLLKGARAPYEPAIWTVTAHVGFGKAVCATPDGRYRGEPVSESSAPPAGADKNGPIAKMLSASSFDGTQFNSGCALNMKFSPSSLNTPEAVQKLRGLMEIFFERSGYQLQINVASTDEMHAAQDDPDAYRDLVVRVAGFSAYFVELQPDAQDELISRTEQDL